MTFVIICSFVAVSGTSKNSNFHPLLDLNRAVAHFFTILA
ncbi:hypothetical protein ADIS_2312 [Lunatimonas lonarensis]|uniref:Uncharacterized protein n=1 Tax=Lunatimonas lonarensis TaxID=1232681 RepID=R7ZT24_9BACT|nr:hypothetical protein ADIS_2312 [Lunatimonas lonarensis]